MSNGSLVACRCGTCLCPHPTKRNTRICKRCAADWHDGDEPLGLSCIYCSVASHTTDQCPRAAELLANLRSSRWPSPVTR